MYKQKVDLGPILVGLQLNSRRLNIWKSSRKRTEIPGLQMVSLHCKMILSKWSVYYRSISQKLEHLEVIWYAEARCADCRRKLGLGELYGIFIQLSDEETVKGRLPIS